MNLSYLVLFFVQVVYESTYFCIGALYVRLIK